MKLAETDDAMLTKKYSFGAGSFRAQDRQRLHTKIEIKTREESSQTTATTTNNLTARLQRRQGEEQTTRL
jgi:hypothetical protein